MLNQSVISQLSPKYLCAHLLPTIPPPHTHTHIHTQLLEVYKNLQHDHDTLKASSEETERKCLQKISEMQEVQVLDHQAKAHMEEAFRLSLEEKDEKISVMQMQVGVARSG